MITRITTYTLLLISTIIAQKSDPRTVALAGATTTIADGIYAVGYNPALIAYQREKPFMMQIGGFDFGLNNNYLSMAGLNFLSGDTLDSDEKTLILNRLENNGGLSFKMNGQAALPVINFASGNMAITSNLMYFSSYTMPAGMARLILEGNANNPKIDMTFSYEIMAVNDCKKEQLKQRLPTNISSVVEFQRWWVLKSKLFVQKSTCSKEILIPTTLNHL